jgi:hypothetical protein
VEFGLLCLSCAVHSRPETIHLLQNAQYWWIPCSCTRPCLQAYRFSMSSSIYRPACCGCVVQCVGALTVLKSCGDARKKVNSRPIFNLVFCLRPALIGLHGYISNLCYEVAFITERREHYALPSTTSQQYSDPKSTSSPQSSISCSDILLLFDFLLRCCLHAPKRSF